MSVGAGTKHQIEHCSERLRAFVEEAPLERRSIFEFVAAAAAELPAGARVADVGAGGAPFRELFEHAEYVTIDRAISRHGDAEDFDIVASADAIPVDDGSFDAVLSTQVLEHLRAPQAALSEMLRILVPGGRLLLTAPLAWEEHEMPHDYYRYTRSGLEALLSDAGFVDVAITPRTDTFTTLAQLLSSARWSLAEPQDESAAVRLAAFKRLEELSRELAALAPLDARHALPLGYAVRAARPREQAVAPPAAAAGAAPSARIPVLYLAPWVDLGGSDKGTIDWFKHIDRTRWAPSIITTQPSPNRWLRELEPYAEEVWALPDFLSGADVPGFVLDFVASRGIRIVHIMNSRIAFDLMPDLTCLAEPPAIVVQLHAEEPDRSGYVRYSASRYGNLVDAFSVTSQQLADAMLDYEVPRSRMHVITTGVDAVGEFDPAAVEPLALDGDGPHVLWPGRLVAQKDPLLTLDVVRLLKDRGLRFTLQVVGDGDMEEDVRRRARELDVEDRIRWHPPSHEMPRWYRSCDLLLMTSVFEGVPYVMYEAQAMGLPIVVPALPGNVELMADADGGVLIDPRDDASAYADALERLIADAEQRAAMGARARERMLRDFTLPEMGAHHDALYERLLERRPVSSRRHVDDEVVIDPDSLPQPPAVTFPRATPPQRSVAVIVPCYQHGRFLPAAIASLREQTLKPDRVIVVDDASEDAETTRALDLLERDPLVTVLRLPSNVGPSAARNRALAHVTESYVLPLDADDMLLPNALREMVEQLERAPEDVGFVYPNPLHFGNRNDYFEAPAYNLHLLMRDNYCAATSLFDRRVFAAGIGYAEEIVYGHEDWDLVLQLAEHGIVGEPAAGPTFLYRKLGFSRINATEYGPDAFHRRIERRHPLLYGRRERIKARWAPALSVVLTGEAWPEGLVEQLAAQSCEDFEVVVAGTLAGARDRVCVVEVEGAGPERVARALQAARGRFVVVAEPAAAHVLGRRTFVEQVLRIFWANQRLPWFAVADVEGRKGAPLAPWPGEDADGLRPCVVAWRREPDGDMPAAELAADESAVEAIARAIAALGPLQWRMA